jgi:hypothetical protein
MIRTIICNDLTEIRPADGIGVAFGFSRKENNLRFLT